jgi:Flp pilus assembly protein TadD
LVAVVVWAAWSNSFTGPFVLDDHGSILGNASIRQLWPPVWLHPPATMGETVSGRPVLNFTFALNHVIGGEAVRGYHVANLLIHTTAALLLWGILRRTPGTGGAGVPLAAALVWAVHPLNTAAVTYVVQRAESLAALFGFLTLYAFIRGATAGGRHWFVVAVVGCWLGMGTKESVVAVPILVVLYDRAFLAGGFRAAWKIRGRVQAALLASWVPLAALVLANEGRGGSVGTDAIGAGTYFLTQCGAIFRYLRLAFWPAGQVFDYGTPTVNSFGAVALPLGLLAALGVATVWLLARNRPAGFVGAVFLFLLAPSSSVLPVATQTIAEHRMYLPLAAVVVLVCAPLASIGERRRRWGFLAVAMTVVALGATTFARNRMYRTELTLWGDTVTKRPDNPRARYNLGLALAGAGRPQEAAAEFRQVLALQPEHAFAHFELGKAAFLAGQWHEAIQAFEAALVADPRFVDARANVARAYARLDRPQEAFAHYRRALADEPGAADLRQELVALLIRVGRVGDEALLREALRWDERNVGAWFALGNLLARQQRFSDAIAAYQSALALDPSQGDVRGNLANSLLFSGRTAEAITHYEMILEQRPGDARVRENLRLAREQLGAR